jgi:hypothetical protein
VPITNWQDVSLIKDDTLTQRCRRRCNAERGEPFGGNDRARLVSCRFRNLCAFLWREKEDLGEMLARDGSGRPSDLLAEERRYELIFEEADTPAPCLRIASRRVLQLLWQ